MDDITIFIMVSGILIVYTIIYFARLKLKHKKEIEELRKKLFILEIEKDQLKKALDDSK